MCGFLFYSDDLSKVDESRFLSAFNSFGWRGPDNHQYISLNEGKALLGHHRLTIVEPSPFANQPMKLRSGELYLLFNGEIYNHLSLREKLKLKCQTRSDTETIAEAYLQIGENVFGMLDGMFSVVIYNAEANSWIAARDAFGIKPLFIYSGGRQTIIGSEASAIANIVSAPLCKESLREWEIIRRPIPGYSYFRGVEEVRPGTIIRSNGTSHRFWNWEPEDTEFKQEYFEELLAESVKAHELNDFDNVSLLSGGLDSALILRLAGTVSKSYSIGLPDNNEFEGALDTALQIGKQLETVETKAVQLEESWRFLTRLRGEPLSLPNEGLIYLVCKAMSASEKVVITGEGADECFFGYDGIFRWALNEKSISYEDFIIHYGYSDNIFSERLKDFFYEFKQAKTPIEFLEDFFYQVHLPGLLRRMDFASMAASKEARVPFVSKKLISYLYRKPPNIKISTSRSKIPIRVYAEKLGLHGALNRKKIGFNASVNKNISRQEDYKQFQMIIRGALEW